MRTQLTAIGNSKGIRLPKAVLAQYGIVDAVDLTLTEQGILLSPVRAVRAGWEDAILTEGADPAAEFREFEALGTAFDGAKWTWPRK